MRNNNRPRPHRPTAAHTTPCPDAAERTSARRRRSAQRASYGVISAYIHDLSQRHRPATPRPV